MSFLNRRKKQPIQNTKYQVIVNSGTIIIEPINPSATTDIGGIPTQVQLQCKGKEGCNLDQLLLCKIHYFILDNRSMGTSTFKGQTQEVAGQVLVNVTQLQNNPAYCEAFMENLLKLDRVNKQIELKAPNFGSIVVTNEGLYVWDATQPINEQPQSNGDTENIK